MNIKTVTPTVIIHEPHWLSPQLPPKFRFDYKTEVNEETDTFTLTVSVMKRDALVRFFLGRDHIIKSASKKMPRTYPAQDLASALEAELVSELFASA